VKTNTNNKACGDDLVIKEYIKSTTEKIIELCEKMLNIIFQSGVIPDSWLNGNMKTIYKNGQSPCRQTVSNAFAKSTI
jgi:hypothetical protein